MNLNDKLPSHAFKATSGLEANLRDYLGQWLVLYFYPRDATPGCTTQGQNFRDAYPDFQKHRATVLGVSRDTLACHERFKAKQGFPFELIDDSDENLCQLYGVMKNKSMFGKPVRGIVRSTFLYNPEGVLVAIWRKVSVDGHVAEVLAKINSLSA